MYISDSCEDKLEAAVLILETVSTCPNCAACRDISRIALEAIEAIEASNIQAPVKSLNKNN